MNIHGIEHVSLKALRNAYCDNLMYFESGNYLEDHSMVFDLLEMKNIYFRKMVREYNEEYGEYLEFDANKSVFIHALIDTLGLDCWQDLFDIVVFAPI